MKIKDLQTPAILIRSNVMHTNVNKYQQECNKYQKQLWPMLKTHKSTIIADIQRQAGATGFLCGTLDECEMLCENGILQMMYAYPVADQVACRRVANLAKKCDFYVRIDSLAAADQLNNIAKEENIVIKYTIILDCGLHRFGMPADKILPFAQKMKQFDHLMFCGISTHCGHVYAESDAAKVPLYAKQEIDAIHQAVYELRSAGFDVKMVTSGATPTFLDTISDDYINIYHPGNYIFNDCIQIANHTATIDECALVVYATVISNPKEDLLICDAGAKCLGLDQGAHGNSALKGFGCVIGHPNLVVAALSEEVGKIHISGTSDVKVGDRIMIVPNHACSSANFTDYYFLIDDNQNVEKIINVDIRSNSTTKGFVKEEI